MIKNLNIAIIGGDKRIVRVAHNLISLGVNTKIWGIDNTYIKDIACETSCEDAVKNADIIVLPTPPSGDDVRINCPLFSEESGIKFHKLLESIQPQAVILGGRISPRFRDMAIKQGFRVYDYFNREELLIKNAVPTAEGAIGVAIEKLPKTIFDAKIAVIGFGRIGEALAWRLKLLGADVTVYARKKAVVAKAQSMGLRGGLIEYIDDSSSLKELTEGYDVIYNTVPYWLITEEIIKKMPSETLLVELASAPGGFDIVAAQKLGVNVIHALSLPNKVAPESAGDIITESIINIISEEEF